MQHIMINHSSTQTTTTAKNKEVSKECLLDAVVVYNSHCHLRWVLTGESFSTFFILSHLLVNWKDLSAAIK